MLRLQHHKGFTIVELIAVMVIIAILGAIASQTMQPNTIYSLQSSRDQVVSAFFMAQQLAMATNDDVELVISSPNIIDVQVNNASVTVGGASYPVTLSSNQTLSAGTFSFSRLGKTSAGSLTLSLDGQSVQINISSTGYVN